jgi:hypothetical protein
VSGGGGIVEQVEVEIRIENDHEVSFIPSNLHAKKGHDVVFFVTTRGGARMRAGGGEATEVIKEDGKAQLTLTFRDGSPFDDVKLTSAEGKIKASVSGAPGIYHYAVAATAQVAGRPAMISVTGCPEIIIQK